MNIAKSKKDDRRRSSDYTVSSDFTFDGDYQGAETLEHKGKDDRRGVQFTRSTKDGDYQGASDYELEENEGDKGDEKGMSLGELMDSLVEDAANSRKSGDTRGMGDKGMSSEAEVTGCNSDVKKLKEHANKSAEKGEDGATKQGKTSGSQWSEKVRRAPPPSRSLSRKSSAKGGSFRGSLRNVVEDKEADMDDCIRLQDETTRVDGEGLPARQLPPKKKSGRGSSFRNSSMKSIRLFSSSSDMSSGSGSGTSSANHNESVNIMDFGVSQCRPFTDSIYSLDDSCIDSRDMSALVDSEGFLAWADDSSSGGIEYRPVPKNRGGQVEGGRRQKRRSSSFDSASMSSLVDSCGFLGWESRQSSIRDFSGSGECAVSKHFDGNEKKKSTNKAQDNLNDDSEELGESWRLEDYEGENYDTIGQYEKSRYQPKSTITGSIKLGVGSVLADQLRRLSSEVTTSSASEQGEQRANTKALRRGRSSVDSLTSSVKLQTKGADGQRNSAFKTFFDRKSSTMSSSSELEDEYSRPAIRINREDGGVDIGEMRRELCQAGKSENTNDAMGRLKMGFFQG